MPLVYACIAPHGGEIVPSLSGNRLGLFDETRRGMRTLARQMKDAKPDTLVLATPHNLRLQKHMGVVTSQYSSGSLAQGHKVIKLKAVCDVDLAEKIVEAADGRGLPVVSANYGTFEGPLSNMPMDWGSLIPLWFLLRGNGLKSRVVLVTPSRGIPLRQNFDLGRIVGEVATDERKRVAFVASADQAHAHKKSGPYGFDKRAAEYDRWVLRAVRSGRLASLMKMGRGFVEAAKPDSLWQMVMLAGVLSAVPMHGEVLSYQVPTYYGMICASYCPF